MMTTSSGSCAPGLPNTICLKEPISRSKGKGCQVLSLMIVNTLPRQEPVRKMERESTAETNSLLLDSSSN